MIALAIVGIIITLALPSYNEQIQRSQSEELITYAEGLTIPTSKCIKKQLALQKANYSDCKSGTYLIPDKIVSLIAPSQILCASVTGGIIKVVGSFDNDSSSAEFGLSYVPDYKNGRVVYIKNTSWQVGDSLLTCP